MTTRDLVIKWTAYGIALLPVWLAQVYLFSALRPFGVCPVLLPLCAMAVCTLEGPVGGAGFGLAAGAVLGATVPGFLPGAPILLLALLGFGAGTLTRYGLRQSFSGCLVCSAGALVILDALHLLLRLSRGLPLAPMVRLAGGEILCSLCFVPLIYPLFHWVYDRVPKATVL